MNKRIPLYYFISFPPTVSLAWAIRYLRSCPWDEIIIYITINIRYTSHKVIWSQTKPSLYVLWLETDLILSSSFFSTSYSILLIIPLTACYQAVYRSYHNIINDIIIWRVCFFQDQEQRTFFIVGIKLFSTPRELMKRMRC